MIPGEDGDANLVDAEGETEPAAGTGAEGTMPPPAFAMEGASDPAGAAVRPMLQWNGKTFE